MADPHHDGSPLYLERDGAEVYLRVRAPSSDPIVEVWLRTFVDERETFTPCQLIEKDAVVQWWEGVLTLTAYETPYRFVVVTADGRQRWLTAAGIADSDGTTAADFKVMWDVMPTTNGVVYEIFPDRFAPSAAAAMRPIPHWAVPAKWDDTVVHDPANPTTPTQHFGGDLDGILDHLDHLAAVGTTAVALTAIGEGVTNHREDGDPETVDPVLGGEQAYERLRLSLSQHGWALFGGPSEPAAAPPIDPGFTVPVWSWLRAATAPVNPDGRGVALPRRSGEHVVDQLRQWRATAGWDAGLSRWNVVGTHATARIRSITGDPRVHRVAAGLQFTLPGVPMIYAGDELGLEGVNAYDGRRPMPWHARADWDAATFSTYTSLAALRRTNTTLVEGGLRWAHVSDDAVVFLREHPTGSLLVAARRAPGPAIVLDASQLGLVDGSLVFGTEPGGPLTHFGVSGVVPGSSSPGLWIWAL